MCLSVCVSVYVSIEMSEHLKGRGCREEQIELENKFVKSDESFPESFVEPNGEESLPSRFFRSRSHDGYYFYKSAKSISRYCYFYSLIPILLPCPSLIFFILPFFALSLLSASESSICAIQRDAVHIHRGCSAQTGL